jgi:hypothetical protein
MERLQNDADTSFLSPVIKVILSVPLDTLETFVAAGCWNENSLA